MAKGTIFVKSVNRVRPWLPGQLFPGISIVDTVGGIRERIRGVSPVKKDEEPDPESTSWPVARAVSNVPPMYPSGILSRAHPVTGELGSYEADDPEILSRLFGHRAAVPEFSLSPAELLNPDWLKSAQDARRRNEIMNGER